MNTFSDRRKFLGHLSGTLVGTVLAGCGGGKNETSATASGAAPVVAPVIVAPVTLPTTSPITPPASSSALRIAPGATFTRAQFEAMTRLHYGFTGDYFDEAYLAALPSSYPDHTPGNMTTDEPSTGARPEIGFNTETCVAWMCTLDPRARACMLANADCSKWFPIHDYVASDGPGVVPKPWLYTQARGGDPAFSPDPMPNPSGIHVEYAHHPQFLFFPTLLMAIERNTAKFTEYLNEMKWWAVRGHFAVPANGRQYEKGIFHTGLQGRAQAWGLRNLVMLHFVLVNYATDQTDWIAWTTQAIEWNVKYVDGMFRTGDFITDGSNGGMNFAPYYDYTAGAYQNNAGITLTNSNAYGHGNDGTTAVLAPWQLAWQQAIFMWASRLDLGLAPAVATLHNTLAQFMAKFVVMLFGPPRDPASYDYRLAGQYIFYVGQFKVEQSVPVTDANPRGITYYATPAQYFAQMSYLPALPADDHSFRSNGHAEPMDPAGLGYSYVDNLVPTLAQAVELNASGAAAAYARFASTSQYAHGGAPAFAILPAGKWYRLPGAPAETT